jgi:NitT/TauT family transport system permease protein/taurine transport system permease protein
MTRWQRYSAILPFALILLAWGLAPLLADYPPYILPSLPELAQRAVEMVSDGSLLDQTLASLQRLALGFAIGNLLAIPLGLAIALNRTASDLLRPALTFLQSIAGIAWVPLAIIWFGIGSGTVIFVIANTIFFATLYSTITGVERIPNILYRAVRSHGGSGLQILTQLVLPGAFVQIILGLRNAMAYGWRALVAAEMIAGTSGLGYMTIEAVQWYQTATVMLGMILIGVLWLVLDRAIFVPIERATIRRWGMIER